MKREVNTGSTGSIRGSINRKEGRLFNEKAVQLVIVIVGIGWDSTASSLSSLVLRRQGKLDHPHFLPT
jgi:hypothetical protein